MSLDSFLKKISSDEAEKKKLNETSLVIKQAEDQAFLEQAYPVFQDIVPKALKSVMRTLERNGIEVYPEEQRVEKRKLSDARQESFSFIFKTSLIQIDVLIDVKRRSIDIIYTDKRNSGLTEDEDNLIIGGNPSSNNEPKCFELEEINNQSIESYITDVIAQVQSKI